MTMIDHNGRLNVDRSFLDRVLGEALNSGGDYADICIQQRISRDASMQDGRVRFYRTSEVAGVGIRLLKEGQEGYAYTESMTEAAILAAARAVRGMSAPSRPSLGLSTLRPMIDLIAAPSEHLTPEMPIAVMRLVDTACRKADSGAMSIDVQWGECVEELVVATSHGHAHRHLGDTAGVSLGVVVRSGDLRSQGRASVGGTLAEIVAQMTTLPERLAADAVKRAREFMDARAAPIGRMAVVLGPGAPGLLLHEAIGHGFEADLLLKGTSRFQGRLGEKVASPLCTIVDDGTLAGGRGSRTFDDEGQPTRCNVLVEDGRMTGALHDLTTAGKMRQASTGSARRESYRFTPKPRMSNTFMRPGHSEPQEIISSVIKGMYVESVISGEVNISNGDFVFYVDRGYLIENGRITVPLRGANLLGNGAEVLTNISLVGNDLHMSNSPFSCGKDGQHVPVGVGLPTIKINTLTVGGQNGQS